MTLQTAGNATTLSIANKPADGIIFETLIINVINSEISRISLLGGYVAVLTLEAEMQSDIIMIKQSDSSYVSLDDIVSALRDRDYRVSSNKKNILSNGISIRLSVAWG